MFGIGLVSIVPVFIIILIILFTNNKSMEDGKFNLIKNIYLYLVSFVTLMMIVVSLYSLIDTSLKQWVFTEADRYYYETMPKPVIGNGEEAKMTDEQWQIEQERMATQEERNRKSNLQRDLTRNISMLLVALPLFAYHWYLIRRKDKLDK